MVLVALEAVASVPPVISAAEFDLLSSVMALLLLMMTVALAMSSHSVSLALSLWTWNLSPTSNTLVTKRRGSAQRISLVTAVFALKSFQYHQIGL